MQTALMKKGGKHSYENELIYKSEAVAVDFVLSFLLLALGLIFKKGAPFYITDRMTWKPTQLPPWNESDILSYHVHVVQLEKCFNKTVLPNLLAFLFVKTFSFGPGRNLNQWHRSPNFAAIRHFWKITNDVYFSAVATCTQLMSHRRPRKEWLFGIRTSKHWLRDQKSRHFVRYRNTHLACLDRPT